MDSDFPVCERIGPEEGKKLMGMFEFKTNDFPKIIDNSDSFLVYIGRKKYVMHKSFGERLHSFYNLDIKPDDHIVCSMPRSGTTITMEMVWLLANDMNFEEAKSRHLSKRYCKLEDETEREVPGSNAKEFVLSVDVADKFPSPRFIQTHASLGMFRNIFNSQRIIYVLRNPKDVIVSAYNFLQTHSFLRFTGTLEDFVDLYVNDGLRWLPHWEHVKEAWESRHRSNIMLIFYEDMCKDLPATLRQVAKFLGKDDYSVDDYARLADHLSFRNFRRNDMVNTTTTDGRTRPEHFIRKGVVNGWKDVLTDDLARKIDEWTARNLEGTGLVFPE